jgi:hypothetical protein
MSVKLLIYIVIGAIYVISRIIKKSGSQPGDISNEPEHPVPTKTATSAKPRQLTFEELLKEISDAKTAQQIPSKPSSKPTYVDYDDDLEDEEKDLETVTYNRDNKVREAYEQAKKQAFERPSLEETLKLNDTVVKFGRFKAFDGENQRNLLEEYTRDFQDREGLKKAFVMSEILNRKF